MKIWPQSSLTENRWFIVLCCLVAVIVVKPIPGHLTITKTRSVDPRLFWTIKIRKPLMLERGWYIRARVDVDFPGHECDNCLIVKRVGCAPGSQLETRGKDFYCDGALIGSSYRDKWINFNLIIGADQVFLIGDNDRSYDSRYFGLVNTNAIDAKLYPVF